MSSTTPKRGRPREMVDPVIITIRIEHKTLSTLMEWAESEGATTSALIRLLLEAAVEERDETG